MLIFSSKSKKYLTESGFQFEEIMRKRNDPATKYMRKLLENRKNRLNSKKLDNSL